MHIMILVMKMIQSNNLKAICILRVCPLIYRLGHWIEDIESTRNYIIRERSQKYGEENIEIRDTQRD